MTLRIVRLGQPRLPGEGTRIGAVRRPPRGVPKERHARDDWYDTWLPELSPSAELVKTALAARDDAEWTRFVRAFRKELATPAASHLLDLLATLSHTADLSVGCYCEDETRCHRSVLRALLVERAADLG